MNDEVFKDKIENIVKLIRTLDEKDRVKLMPLVDETIARHRDIKTSAANAQIAVDGLRLLIKYLIFDLEATRRELRDEKEKNL